MSEKKPLTEGTVRGVQKGLNKPSGNANLKPIKPPPAPTPAKPSDSVTTSTNKK